MIRNTVIVFVMLLLLGTMTAIASDKVEFQPHFDAYGDSTIGGFCPRIQVVLPNLNTTAVPWNLYVGGQKKWVFENSSSFSVEFLSGCKGFEGSTSGLISWRTDAMFNLPLPLKMAGRKSVPIVTSTDMEYYFRDRGFYAYFSIEKRIWGPVDKSWLAGIEAEYYTDKYGTPADLDFAVRLNLSIGKVHLRPAYYFDRELLRIYFAMNFSS